MSGKPVQDHVSVTALLTATHYLDTWEGVSDLWGKA